MYSTADIALAAVFSVLALVNLLGNTLVCIIVLRYASMRTSMNFLLVNLAVSDILVAFSLLPQYVLNHTFVHPSGTAGNYLCRFVTGGNFLWLGNKSSDFTLVIIAFERYFAVLHPYRARGSISTKNTFKLIFICWVLALVLNGPLFWMTSYSSNPEFHCPEKWTSKTFGQIYTVICYFIFGTIPLGVIVYLYTRVVYALWNSKDHITFASPERVTNQNRKKVTIMVIIVTLLFGVLRFPNLIVYMLSEFDIGYRFASTSYIVSVALVAFNSTVNPFVYSLHSTKFREHLVRLFCLRSRGENYNERRPLLK